MTAALYASALVVAGVQFLRVRERRLLPVMALLGLLAAAHARGMPERWAKAFHIGAGLTSLVVVFVLTPRASR